MKCCFRRHQFKHAWDQVVGGLVGRYCICKHCNEIWVIWWHWDIKRIERTYRRRIRSKWSLNYFI